MPVILPNEAEFDGWLTASADAALVLQRPLPDDELMIVATGERQDEAA
jgi:putative SOS response-associated peptidase YedK